MTDLKPCPFCGGEARILCIQSASDKGFEPGLTMIHCTACRASVWPSIGDEEKVAERWNRRVEE